MFDVALASVLPAIGHIAAAYNTAGVDSAMTDSQDTVTAFVATNGIKVLGAVGLLATVGLGAKWIRRALKG